MLISPSPFPSSSTQLADELAHKVHTSFQLIAYGPAVSMVDNVSNMALALCIAHVYSKKFACTHLHKLCSVHFGGEPFEAEFLDEPRCLFSRKRCKLSAVVSCLIIDACTQC